MNKRAADYFHPAVTIFYTVTLTVMAMLFFNPVFIVLGLLFAAMQNILMCGGRRFLIQLLWSLPLCIIVVILNPLVSHGGKTLLFYFWGNPVTVEATIYGICSGGMLLLVFLWFGVYNRVVTPDRFMYLFSRLAPAASMLVTMTQRMIPLFSQRFGTIVTTQKTLPPLHGAGRLKSKFSAGLKEISILLGWSMEDGLDTADSMKARGYGSAKRSSFSIYHFTIRDAAAFAVTAAAAAVCIIGYYSSVSFYFYPRIYMNIGVGGIVSAVSYIILAVALPVTEAKWAIMWKICSRRQNGAADERVKQIFTLSGG